MTGVTIGIGEEYRFYAEEAARRFTKFTGLPVVILTEKHIDEFKKEPIIRECRSIAEKSFYLKFFMLEIVNDDICYFDCDYCVVDNWYPDRVFNGQFTAVKDRTRYLYDHHIMSSDIARYINAGFYMFSKDHKKLFERCRELAPHVKKTFHDQCVINAILQLDKTPVRYLDRRFNCMDLFGVMEKTDVKSVHTSGNYVHYKEGTTLKGTGEFQFDEIMMIGLAGPATLVDETKKQRNMHLYPDGTTSSGDVWFCTTKGEMYLCTEYINNPILITNIYQQP